MNLATGKQRILIIDDEAAVLRSLRRVLARSFDVACAESVAAAFAILDAGEYFDAVLCDMYSGELTGKDFYDRLLVRDPYLASRTILMSGAAPSGAFGEALAGRWLSKPFTADDLLAQMAHFAVPLPTAC